MLPPLNFTSLAALITLSALEIVLNVDNLVFIAIIVESLPGEHQTPTRRLGVALAFLTRLALLFSITWVMSLKENLFVLLNHSFTGHDLVLIFGGLFLVAKATQEFHKNTTADDKEIVPKIRQATVLGVAVQIALIDIIFSLDSVITAVGMAQNITIMIVAIVIAMFVMLFASASVAKFIKRYPTIKVLALSFLILIGVTLLAEGFGTPFDKGYIYFAMAFALMVEFLNMRQRK